MKREKTTNLQPNQLGRYYRTSYSGEVEEYVLQDYYTIIKHGLYKDLPIRVMEMLDQVIDIIKIRNRRDKESGTQTRAILIKDTCTGELGTLQIDNKYNSRLMELPEGVFKDFYIYYYTSGITGNINKVMEDCGGMTYGTYREFLNIIFHASNQGLIRFKKTHSHMGSYRVLSKEANKELYEGYYESLRRELLKTKYNKIITQQLGDRDKDRLLRRYIEEVKSRERMSLS